jgi:hypothetical protein
VFLTTIDNQSFFHQYSECLQTYFLSTKGDRINLIIHECRYTTSESTEFSICRRLRRTTRMECLRGRTMLCRRSAGSGRRDCRNFCRHTKAPFSRRGLTEEVAGPTPSFRYRVLFASLGLTFSAYQYTSIWAVFAFLYIMPIKVLGGIYTGCRNAPYSY